MNSLYLMHSLIRGLAVGILSLAVVIGTGFLAYHMRGEIAELLLPVWAALRVHGWSDSLAPVGALILIVFSINYFQIDAEKK